MDKKDVMEKYRMFVADYNEGGNKADLCAKYRLAARSFLMTNHP